MIAARGRDTLRPDDTCLRFRIGSISISVRSELAEVLEDFGVLYSGCRGSGTAPDRAIHMEVRASKRWAIDGGRYAILGDGETLFRNLRRDEALPYLEWGINWRVMATRSEYLQLHAATLAHNGRAVVFAGPSGTGKSTLAAGLVARGWSYLSDEFALIDPDTLRVHPFPKALCVKAGSFDLVERLNLPLWRRRHYVKAFKGRVGYISTQDIAPQVETRPRPIRCVLFPKYAEGGEPHLYPVSRARAAFSLAGYAFNRTVFGDQTVSVLSQVVRGAECFGVASGPLNRTCDLIEALL
jgi:HprK-related kinase A